MKMREVNRLNLRRHSDSSLLPNRIPSPLHDTPSNVLETVEENEEFDDDWFRKLVNNNEPPRVPSEDNLAKFPELIHDDADIKDCIDWASKFGIDRFWKRGSITITRADPSYKVAYLGNVLTGMAKGDFCTDKPLATLWKNYTSSSKPDVQMKLSVTQSGLKAVTKDHGLTEYWSHRITHCYAPPSHPRVFCWIYRHEGRKLKQELRCHAVLCSKPAIARRMAATLRMRLAQALSDFKRDKILRQNARLSLANSVYENPSLPRRKILLSTGSYNYRPPLERSKSAPKLMAIEESLEEEDDHVEVIPLVETKSKHHRKSVDLKSLHKKFCSSFENLLDGKFRKSQTVTLPLRKPEESILKKGESRCEMDKPRKSVSFESDDPLLPLIKCTEKKETVEEESDESTNSLQSISSTSSEDKDDFNNKLKNYDLELDSLSEDDEDVVSDESGFAELVDASISRLNLDSKEKDTPFHKIIKDDLLRPIESSCLQV